MNKTDTAYILVGKDWAKKERRKESIFTYNVCRMVVCTLEKCKVGRRVKMCGHGGQGPGLGPSVRMGSRKP